MSFGSFWIPMGDYIQSCRYAKEPFFWWSDISCNGTTHPALSYRALKARSQMSFLLAVSNVSYLNTIIWKVHQWRPSMQDIILKRCVSFKSPEEVLKEVKAKVPLWPPARQGWKSTPVEQLVNGINSSAQSKWMSITSSVMFYMIYSDSRF